MSSWLRAIVCRLPHIGPPHAKVKDDRRTRVLRVGNQQHKIWCPYPLEITIKNIYCKIARCLGPHEDKT